MARWPLLLTAIVCVALVGVSGAQEVSEPDWVDCLTKPLATQARVSPTRVRFCGRMNAQSARAFQRLLAPADTTVEIASLGGELEWPVVIAELVWERRLSVDVIGPCLSGCASFVFVAGANRRVRGRGWLGLHNTSSSATFLVEHARGVALAASDAPLLARADREQALYRSRGVRAELLLAPQARIGTICIEAGPHGPSGETEYRLHTRATFWTPTKAQWLSYGVAFEGRDLGSANRAARVARNTLPATAWRRLDLVYDPSPAQQPEAMLGQVTWCAPASDYSALFWQIGGRPA